MFSASKALFTFVLALGPHSHALDILNTTAAGTDLQTWWHDSGEWNFETAVQDTNVRQSHVYSAWVGTEADSNTLYVPLVLRNC